jgi:hypothetical protein
MTANETSVILNIRRDWSGKKLLRKRKSRKLQAIAETRKSKKYVCFLAQGWLVIVVNKSGI